MSFKFLINPFFCVLVLQMLLCLRLRVRLLFLLTVLLALFSAPFSGKLLSASLATPPPHSNIAPQFIFILAGGYLPGATSEEDVLGTESARRVLHGVTVWQRYPAARLVFSGAEFVPVREPERGVQLMAELAQSRGIPISAVILEAKSRNTREHPFEALKLPGVQKETPILLVTSAWHMKRAQKEFQRYFKYVQIDPALEPNIPLTWQDFIPDADVLSKNTTFIREWVAMLWYSF